MVFIRHLNMEFRIDGSCNFPILCAHFLWSSGKIFRGSFQYGLRVPFSTYGYIYFVYSAPVTYPGTAQVKHHVRSIFITEVTFTFDTICLSRKWIMHLSDPFQCQGRSQELEIGGAKLLGEGSGGRLRPKGGCTCTCGPPPPPGYGLDCCCNELSSYNYLRRFDHRITGLHSY